MGIFKREPKPRPELPMSHHHTFGLPMHFAPTSFNPAQSAGQAILNTYIGNGGMPGFNSIAVAAAANGASPWMKGRS